MNFLFLAVAGLGLAFSLLAKQNESVLRAYEEIADIRHPTIDDYRKIQQGILASDRPYHKMQTKREYLNPKIIGDGPGETPVYGCIAVNCSEEFRENCVLTYASFNLNYPQGVQRLIDDLVQSDFVGHILYRIGGWPNALHGDLVLAHVPFAFKVCFFREAKDLGYQRALWMDCSILPLISLNDVFGWIENEGYFALSNWHTVGPYMNEDAAAAFGLTLKQADRIRSCQAGLFGIDFTQSQPAELIDALYEAAKHPDAFFSSLCDQNALSILMTQRDMTEWWPSDTLAPWMYITQNTLFLIDREFVKNASGESK